MKLASVYADSDSRQYCTCCHMRVYLSVLCLCTHSVLFVVAVHVRLSLHARQKPTAILMHITHKCYALAAQAVVNAAAAKQQWH
jgi:hypothetical protein